MQLDIAAKSWVGIGWHCWDCSDTGMTNADFSIGIFDENGVVSFFTI